MDRIWAPARSKPSIIGKAGESLRSSRIGLEGQTENGNGLSGRWVEGADDLCQHLLLDAGVYRIGRFGRWKLVCRGFGQR